MAAQVPGTAPPPASVRPAGSLWDHPAPCAAQFPSQGRHNRQMFHYWRNTLRMGGQAALVAPFSDSTTVTKQVNLDTAPAFAAWLIDQDRPMTQLFTAQSNTCPTFDLSTNKFVNGECFVANGSTATMPGNNVPAASQAGILTNPGFMAQYYSNCADARPSDAVSRPDRPV